MTVNQNLVVAHAQRMSSLEIAEITGKQHKNLMRDIINMESAWEKTCGLKFELTSRTIIQPNGGTRVVPYYSLNKMECLYIASKFNDETRAKLILRWQQWEQERMMQQQVRHLLVTDEDVMNEAERIVTRTLNSNNQHADGCITTSDIAKGIGLDTKDLNAFLCDKGVQAWRRGQFRLTPDYEGRGLAQDRLFIYYSKNGKQKERTYLVWTSKGANLIWEMTRK